MPSYGNIMHPRGCTLSLQPRTNLNERQNWFAADLPFHSVFPLSQNIDISCSSPFPQNVTHSGAQRDQCGEPRDSLQMYVSFPFQ